jgi:hypothetical protein
MLPGEELWLHHPEDRLVGEQRLGFLHRLDGHQNLREVGRNGDGLHRPHDDIAVLELRLACREAGGRVEGHGDLLDLVVGDEGAVDAGDAAAAGHVEHVALAEQLFGALLAKDGAAVDLRRDLEGDAGREVGLDRAGDDVDRRALRRHDHVDAGGARHLREALDRAFDVLAGDHHQVGHLVDDDDDDRASARGRIPRSRRSARRSRSSKPVCTVRVIVSPLALPRATRC